VYTHQCRCQFTIMPQPWTPGWQKTVQQKQGADLTVIPQIIPQIIPASAQAASGKPSGKKRQAASGKRIRPSCKKDGGKDGCKAKGKGRKRPEQKAKCYISPYLLAPAKGKARGSVRSMRPVEPKFPPPAHLLLARAATTAVEVLGQLAPERATRPWRLPNSSGSSDCLPEGVYSKVGYAGTFPGGH